MARAQAAAVMDMRIMGMGSSASSPAPVAAPRRSHGVGKLQDHVPSPHPARVRLPNCDTAALRVHFAASA
jgi:hypothetical protein